MIEVLTTQKFSLIIERLVLEKKMPYIDAVCLWCEDNGMEIETASKLLNVSIKEKIKVEAQDLNFLEKEARLPLE
jgi:hypothetical protein